MILFLSLFLLCFAGDPIDICLEQVATGNSLIDVRVKPGTSEIFVSQKDGRLSRVNTQTKSLDAVFSMPVRTNGESGFLSFAFHPSYGTNGEFGVYTYHIDSGTGDTVLSAWTMDDASGNLAQNRVLLRVPQPFGNHQGSWIGFSPLDGYLYVTLGDGGASNDAARTGQNKQSFLGKILRLDVDGKDAGKEYRVPEDNPYVGNADYLPEIFSMGVRNPFRCSFHPFKTNLLYVADVGQNTREPLKIVDTRAVVANRRSNLGWPVFEGFHCNTRASSAIPVTATTCAAFFNDVTHPVFEYQNTGGTSIMGGTVYRGSADSRLTGRYLFSDYVRCVAWDDNLGRWASNKCTTLTMLALDPTNGADTHFCPEPCPLQSSGMQESDYGWVHEVRVRMAPGSSFRWGGQVWSFGEDARGEALVLNKDALLRVADPALCGIAVATVTTTTRPTTASPTAPPAPLVPLVEPTAQCAVADATAAVGGTSVAELTVTLTVQVGRVETDAFGINTRTFNGQVPGPTIVVAPGTRLKINLVNALGPETADSRTGKAGMDAENPFHLPNTTNLHVHGLHVSPAGNADNMRRKADPGETISYEYLVDVDHPSGTFWFHAHHHGSVAMQVDGGLGGALIVADRREGLDPVLAAMREHVVVLQQFAFSGLEEVGNAVLLAQGMRSQLVQDLRNSGGRAVYMLANGQLQPQVSLKRQEPVRLRLINAGGALFIYAPVPQGCVARLLAQDGVYSATPLRQMPNIVIPPGGRADVILECSTAGVRTVSSVALSEAAHEFLSNAEVFEGPLWSLNVANELHQSAATVPTTVPARPAYLQDLTSDTTATPQNIAFGTADMTINGVRFAKSKTAAENAAAASLQPLTLGQTVEYVVSSGDSANHPYHQHVNHFQVVDFTVPDEAGAFAHANLVKGSFRDTVPASDANGVRLRFSPHRFVGAQVAHCHVGAHSDMGMLTEVPLVDEDGVAGMQGPDASLTGDVALSMVRAALRDAPMCAARPTTTTTGLVTTSAPISPTAAANKCGNNVVDPGEDCEPVEGACCLSNCKWAAAGATCRALEQNELFACDVADVCDGKSALCVDRKAEKGTVCKKAPADAVCQSDAVCDGVSGQCPVLVIDIDRACDDGNACTSNDRCNQYGDCRGRFDLCDCETNAQCNQDGDNCSVDECKNKKCVSRLADPGLLCDDRDPCTVDDRCAKDGSCVGLLNCEGGCNAPNGRCCGGSCECDSAWSGMQCEMEAGACVVGDLGCPCTAGLRCDGDFVCECTTTSGCDDTAGAREAERGNTTPLCKRDEGASVDASAAQVGVSMALMLMLLAM